MIEKQKRKFHDGWQKQLALDSTINHIIGQSAWRWSLECWFAAPREATQTYDDEVKDLT